MTEHDKMGLCWAAALLGFQAIAAFNFWVHQPALGTAILAVSWIICCWELYWCGARMGVELVIEEAGEKDVGGDGESPM